MTDRRDLLLREMGLGLRWVLRASAPSAEPAVQIDVADVPNSSGAFNASNIAINVDFPAVASVAVADMDWAQLATAVKSCQACGLCASRKQTVFGVGDQSADVMIIGEAPGAEEDRLGEPFVGPAGQLLDSMLAAVKMKRTTKIYIANVLKCRPPDNRNPSANEVAQCSPHLQRQIALVKPKLIVAMGRFAAQTLLATDASIASMRGKQFSYHNTPLIVTYHPAYLLRSLPDKAKAWEDLLFMRQTLAAT